ncbi:MAG: FAD-dependent oxidoreductase [Bowdeniella nasicola]|nr:FAD-dependent oxidoreductase [Bowdeniella nasicola]
MNIVVIGGVAGGMSAAARARRLNEEASIIVLERGDYVSFANCGLPYHISGEIEDRSELLLHTPETLKSRLNLDVRLRTEAVRIDREKRTVTARGPEGEEELAYDALILSPGAATVMPPIEGLPHPSAHTLRTINDMDAIIARLSPLGEHPRAVVVGAGFIGLEAVEALRERGAAVSLVEFAPHVLPPIEAELASYVSGELARHDVDVREGTSVQAIADNDGAARLTLSDGSTLDADLVILATGVAPDSALAKDAGLELGERGAIVVDGYLQTSDPHIWAAGDAVQVRQRIGDQDLLGPVPLAAPANRHGRRAADAAILGAERAVDQVGDATAAPRVLGTAIVRVFGAVAALTGASRRTLDSLGVDYVTVHTHPADHAGYYPGAEQMHIVAHFRRSDGLLLGAHIVGGNGVANRINVFATALKAGMTASDLADLDLAYAPPFGSAKDPVQMTGFTAQNILADLMPVWYAEDLDEVRESSLLLDTRSAGECARGMVSGSLNVPHTEVRERLEEIREAAAGRPIAVLCASGVRSYLATRILREKGFEARNLSGGAETLAHVRSDWAD